MAQQQRCSPLSGQVDACCAPGDIVMPMLLFALLQRVFMDA
jgi:hypothetical protein